MIFLTRYRNLRWRWPALFAVLYFSVAIVGLNSVDSARAAEFRTDEVTIISVRGKFRVMAEIAETDTQRAQGLQFRQQLAPDRGMLFDFGRDQPVFMWMKNTFIPLDMVFIDEGGKVARVVENTTPMSLSMIRSGVPVRAVLEIAAGGAARMGIAKGALIKHSIFGRKP
jgi:uncharacterized protein